MTTRQKWKNSNTFLGRGKCQDIQASDGTMITNPQEICDMFSNAFSGQNNAARAESTAATQHLLPNEIKRSLFFEPVTVEEVVELLKAMKPKRSVGADGISQIILKNCMDIIAQPLACCMNKFFNEFRFPESLKIAKVVLIHKGGSMLDLDNFRSLTVVSLFSKIFEMAMCSRLVNFLETKGFFCQRQLKKKIFHYELLH